MFRIRPRLLPMGAALLVACMALVLGGVPARAQQSAPAARHSAPPTATAGRATNVPVQFDLPAGYRVQGFPRLRVVDSRGKLCELRPCYITQKPPAGRGQRTLNTHRYRRGQTYQVRVECDFQDASGKTGTAVSPWSPLTAP